MLQLASAPHALLAEMTIPKASIQSRVQRALFSVAMPAVFLKKKNQTTKWGIFSLDRFTDPVYCTVSHSERVVSEQGWELPVLMFLQRQRYAELC